MIPSDIKFDGNATPPQFTDNADQVIERGTHIRVKIKGIRGEVGQMYAIATIKEDFLGYVFISLLSYSRLPLTVVTAHCSRLESCCYKREALQPATKTHESTKNQSDFQRKGKRKEHPRLKFIASQKPGTEDAQKTYFAETAIAFYSWHHAAYGVGKEKNNRRSKERKHKNAFDIIL